MILEGQTASQDNRIFTSMKNRLGFVSNSSSASFIIKFQTSKTKEEIEFDIKNVNSWVEEHWENSSWNYLRDKPIQRLSYDHQENCWVVLSETSMFNDWMDVDIWLFVRMLSEIPKEISKYTLNKIIQVDYEDEKEVVFDPRSFLLIYSDPSVLKEGNERKTEYDDQFLEYLYKINIPLTEEQINYLAKYQLMK